MDNPNREGVEGGNDIQQQQQRAKLREAAMLAARGMFCCAACGKHQKLEDGLIVVARKNVVLGVCLQPACVQEGLSIRPTESGLMVRRIASATTPAVIQATDLSTIRAVEATRQPTKIEEGE